MSFFIASVQLFLNNQKKKKCFGCYNIFKLAFSHLVLLETNILSPKRCSQHSLGISLAIPWLSAAFARNPKDMHGPLPQTATSVVPLWTLVICLEVKIFTRDLHSNSLQLVHFPLKTRNKLNNHWILQKVVDLRQQRDAKYLSKSLQCSLVQEDFTEQFPHFIHTAVPQDKLDLTLLQESDLIPKLLKLPRSWLKSLYKLRQSNDRRNRADEDGLSPPTSSCYAV